MGRKTVRSLLDRIEADKSPPDPDDLADIMTWFVPDRAVDRQDVSQALVEADGWLEMMDRLRIRVLVRDDAAFPSLLRAIPDPPIAIFVHGSIDALVTARPIAVIGTREPTEFGQEAARRIGKRLAELGVTVVSGLAMGCDALAHEGCVNARGIGVAVMAHGLDRIFPAENRSLAEQLLECGGCLVSEYPPGTPPHRGNFIERDRLQSGLSRAVIVVETDVKGGTMHTVGFAKEQRRWIACLDHPTQWIDAPKVQGNRQMLRLGEAKPIGDRDALDRFAEWVFTGGAESVVSERTSRGEMDEQGSLWD